MMNKIIFTLSPEEVKKALYTARVLKPYKTKCIVVLCLSVVLSVLAAFNSDSTRFVIPAALLIVNLFYIFGNKNNEKRVVEGSTTGAETILTVTETLINVTVPSFEADWNIEREDVASILENDEQIIIVLADYRLIAIPIKAVDEQTKQPLQDVLDYFRKTDDKKEIEDN